MIQHERCWFSSLLMGSTHPNPAGFTCRARINLFIWLQISMIQPFKPKHKRNPKRWSKEELKREYTDSRLPLKNWTGVRQRRRYDGLWGAIVTFPRRQPFATNVIVATASAQRRRESPSCVSPKFIIFDYLQMSKAGNYSWQVERRLTPNWGRPKGPWYGKWQPRHWHMYVWPTGCKLRYTSRFFAHSTSVRQIAKSTRPPWGNGLPSFLRCSFTLFGEWRQFHHQSPESSSK